MVSSPGSRLSLALTVARRGRGNGPRVLSGPPVGRCAGFQRDLGFVVEPQVAVIDLERKGRQGRAVDPAPLGSVQAAIGLPASRLMARDGLQADDLVSDLGVPLRPGFATVLVKRERGVIPVVDVGLAAIRVIAAGGTRPPRNSTDRDRRLPGTGGRPRPRRSWSG